MLRGEKREHIKIYYVFENVPCYTVIYLSYFIVLNYHLNSVI